LNFIRLFAAFLGFLFVFSHAAGAGDRGNFGPFQRSLSKTKHGYQKQHDPTGQAPVKRVEKFEVRPGDCWKNAGWNDCEKDRERSELSEKRKTTKVGDEYWYGWSIYAPKDWQNVWPTKTALGQFHQKGAHVIWMFQNDKGGLLLDQQTTGRTVRKYPLLTTLELRGRWNRIEVHVKWSTRKDGFLDVYVNGTKKVAYRGKTMTAQNVYFKYGVYRSFLSRYKKANGTKEVPGQTAYYANVKRADSRDGLRP
jgi:hypothetical protein